MASKSKTPEVTQPATLDVAAAEAVIAAHKASMAAAEAHAEAVAKQEAAQHAARAKELRRHYESAISGAMRRYHLIATDESALHEIVSLIQQGHADAATVEVKVTTAKRGTTTIKGRVQCNRSAGDPWFVVTPSGRRAMVGRIAALSLR